MTLAAHICDAMSLGRRFYLELRVNVASGLVGAAHGSDGWKSCFVWMRDPID